MKAVKKFFSEKSSTTALYLFIFSFVMISCQESEISPDSGNISSTNQHTAVSVSEVVKDIDKEFFGQISTLSNSIKSNHIWEGLDLTKERIYFVYVDKDNQPTRGFILNPHIKFDGALEIFKSDSHGMNISVYNGPKGQMLEVLNNANSQFVPNYDFNDKKYHIIKYSDTEVADHSASSVLVSGIFVSRQGTTGENWAQPDVSILDPGPYPYYMEGVALQILSLSTLKSLPTLTNPEEIKDILGMYVAIRSKEMELDPTEDYSVKNIANYMEWKDGATNYVEKMSQILAYSTGQFIIHDPFKMEEAVGSKEDIKNYFTSEIWGETGASVIYCLKSLGVEVEPAIRTGKAPYELANEYLGLNNNDKEVFLNKAKQSYNWELSIKSAERYLGVAFEK